MTTTPKPELDAAPAWASAAAAASLLAACGGGGGGEAPAPSPPPPGGGQGQAPAPAPAPAPVPAVGSDAEAARFLAQAGFGATAAEIQSLRASSYAAWLEQQFAMAPGQSHHDWLLDHGFGGSPVFGFDGVDNALWRQWLSAPDVLRQRMVLACSEIFVVSMQGIPVRFCALAVAAYVDMLGDKVFGSYRDLLQGVALSVAMGAYLNMLGSKKAGASVGSQPDENFARELMQLMSIGLVQLNLDGTPKLDTAGQPQATYNQGDVSKLAAVFTGWTYDGWSMTDAAFVRRPMVNVAGNFSTGAKQVLDVAIPASASGPAAMQIALDTLANHPNVGPFIGRQLIQRLVCSHPSPAYVQRVATVFNSNGAGQRGDLKAVIKAVLLDPEARTPGSGPATGRLREPVQRFIQWGRSFGVTSPTGLWNIGDTSSPGLRLGQCPLRSPSVFNFFRPGYVPPNSLLGTNGVTAPEFQLCNESTVAGYLNFMQAAIASGVGEVRPDYTAQLALAGDVPALVAQIALLMAAGGLSPATLATITGAVGAISAATDAGRLNRVQAAILLVMASPEYQIQK